MTMKRTIRTCAAVVGLIATQAHAGWTCAGKVTEMTLDPSGNLYMSLLKSDGSYAWQYKPLCSLRTDTNGVVAQSCKSIYALLTTSVALGKTVTFWFDYPNATTPDCSSARFPAWAPLATDGSSPWYFGPKLD